MKHYQVATGKLFERYKSSKDGLSEKQIGLNQDRYGKNILVTKKQDTVFSLFIDQLNDPIIFLLIGAIIISFLTGDKLEAALILAVVLLMAVLGTFLENSANNSLAKLKEMTSKFTKVIREGKIQKVLVQDVVVGDILYLAEGDKIPADARVFNGDGVVVDESMLTGESVGVVKHTEVIDKEVLLGEQSNMIFTGTYIIQGSVKAVVVSVGKDTELGEIANKLATTEEQPTPLQVQLDKVAKIILWGTLVVTGIIFILTIIRGQDLLQALVQAVSLAIAFIPEGLSAVLTITLALGVREMVKDKVIIKKLLAAEGLGSVQILCTDKTGTITAGKMSVEYMWYPDKKISASGFKATNKYERSLMDVLRYCNSNKGATEAALVNFVEDKGFVYEIDENKIEHRFSSELKRMMVIKHDNVQHKGYAKGAPETLIPFCKYYLNPEIDKEIPLDDDSRAMILDKVNHFAKKGHRVLLLAYRHFDADWEVGNREADENDLIFAGLIGLLDPLRPEVKDTVTQFKEAGIRPVMITGDHPEIARSIALEAGIIEFEKAEVITGMQLNEYFATDDVDLAFEKRVLSCNVFARVSPDHKNKLVDLYRSHNKIIAMAGDGINDAVAIVRADVGISVVNGLDVVKEAADVIITGGYDALSNAVKQGRVIIQRTRLYLHYILSGNVCEVGVFILAIAFNLPIPITAIALLIINMLTDTIPAIAMVKEKESEDIMKEHPRQKSEGIITKNIWISITLQGLVSSAFLFGVYVYFLDQSLLYAQTAVFTAYIFQKGFRAFTARSLTDSIFTYGVFSNKYIIGAVIYVFVSWYFVVYVAGDFFHFTPLEYVHLATIASIALVMPIIEEIYKMINRRS